MHQGEAALDDFVALPRVYVMMLDMCNLIAKGIGGVDMTAVAFEMAIAVQIHPPNGLERPWLKLQ
jgi:hypothetical protein